MQRKEGRLTTVWFRWNFGNYLSLHFTCINVLSVGIDFVAALTSSSILGSLDKKYLIKLNSFLAPVLRSSSCSRFVRCWRAKTDGWAASTFHSNCDGKGPTVTIIQVGSYIFGGYTDVSWSSKYHFISRAGFFQFVSLLNGKRLLCSSHLFRLNFSF